MLIASSGDTGNPDTYQVELDNAFGLNAGSEVHIAGVLDGDIASTTVDSETGRAVLTFHIAHDDFGGLRTDASCDVRLQSLIGDYYLDCQPGSSPRRLQPGARIPVTHTTETVPVDLINDIQRYPYRERLSLFVDELGAAAAGNGENLNAAIHRFVPALHETDEVLATLAGERQAIERLTSNADVVISALAHNRRDVGRWVQETRALTGAAATRSSALSEGFARLPGFLHQLTPTMAALEQAAHHTAPALVALGQVAPATRLLLQQLAQFSDAANPAVGSLGRAAVTGEPAMHRAPPLIHQLGLFAEPAADVANNLAIVLEHLNSPAYAVDKNSKSPRGQGFTGLEAPLQWAVNLGLVNNTYTADGHFQKVFPLVDQTCQQYVDAQSAREYYSQCSGAVGPTQPGVLTPDPTASTAAAASNRRTRSSTATAHNLRSTRLGSLTGTATASSPADTNGGPPLTLPRLPLPSLSGLIASGPVSQSDARVSALLRYLLGP